MALPSTIEEYFQLADAERVLALEIARNHYLATRYYISDAPYQTEEGDDPSMMVFSPIIGEPGMPELKRTMADPFDGSGSVTFGSVTLVDIDSAWRVGQPGVLAVDGDGTMLDTGDGSVLSLGEAAGVGGIILKRGASVTGKLCAPRRFYPYDSAQRLFTGQIARTGRDSTGKLTFEITSRTDTFRKTVVPITTRPLCFGRCRNVELLLIDPVNLIYAAHDGAINAILSVYDQGAILTDSLYTVDLAAGTVQLAGSAAGTVTADVEGAVIDGVWLSSTAQIATELIRRAGQEIEQDYGSVDDGIIGFFALESFELGPTLTDLFRGAVAYWLIDEDDMFVADSYPVPGAAGVVYDEQQMLSEVGVQDDDRLHRSIPFRYRRNWTKYQARSGASQEMADFSQREGLEDSVELAEVDAELGYQDSQLLETFFDSLGSAQNAARRLLDIFGVERRWVTTDLPYLAPRRLGGSISLSSAAGVYRAVVFELTDVFDGGYPVQRVRVLA